MKRLVCAILLLTSFASAEERAAVRIHLVGPVARDATLGPRLASWFEPHRFVVRVENAPYLDPRQVLTPERGARVDAWVTLRTARQARLYFASKNAQDQKVSYVLRDLQLEQGLDELGTEQLSQAVHWSTVALLEGRTESTREQVRESLAELQPTEVVAPPALVPQPEPERPVKVDTASRPRPRPRPRSRSLAAALGYALTPSADEGVAHGPRLCGGVHFGELHLNARLQAHLPRSVEVRGASLELYGGAISALAGARLYRDEALSFALFAGPTLLWSRFAARERDFSQLRPEEAASELRPGMTVGASLAFGTAPRVALVPELAVWLSRGRYDVALGERRETVAESAWLTPSLGLELEL